jgi:hypothetical protein
MVDVSVLVTVYGAVGVSVSVAVGVIVGMDVAVGDVTVAGIGDVVGVETCCVDGIQAAVINPTSRTILNFILSPDKLMSLYSYFQFSKKVTTFVPNISLA